MNKHWSRRFQQGEISYNTQAFLDTDCVIIKQSENMRGTSTPNSIILTIEDFKKMAKKLGVGG